jgi:hypothetical protein
LPTTLSLQRVSDQVVELASDILRMSPYLKKREMTEFVRAKPPQRARIAAALQLTEGEVDDLIASNHDTPDDASNHENRPQVWDYDTKTATVADLTRRRDLLTTRLRILAYLQVH